MARAREATAACSEDNGGGKMWLKWVCSAAAGHEAEDGALIACLG
jgi:hypothetical protein